MKKILSKKRFTLSQSKGFTLIELMVVMAIIAILAVLIIGAITTARNTARLTVHRSNAKTIQTGFEAYFAKTRAYPATSGTVSFATAAESAGVSLTGAPECTVAAQGGGGQVTYTVSGYTITPYDAACTTALTGEDVLTQ